MFTFAAHATRGNCVPCACVMRVFACVCCASQCAEKGDDEVGKRESMRDSVDDWEDLALAFGRDDFWNRYEVAKVKLVNFKIDFNFYNIYQIY